MRSYKDINLKRLLAITCQALTVTAVTFGLGQGCGKIEIQPEFGSGNFASESPPPTPPGIPSEPPDMSENPADEIPAAEESLGLHYTLTELSEWRKRANSGPYKQSDDVSPNSPGDYQRILSNANSFLQNPSAELVTEGFGVARPELNHIKTRDAAFIYLLHQDMNYGSAVRSSVLAQIRHASQQPEGWGFPHDVAGSFVYAEYLSRLLSAYDYTKDLYSESETQEIRDWLRRTANHLEENINRDLSTCFPNRQANDYSERRSQAATFYSTKNTFVYPDGTIANQIAHLAHYYNNRRSSQVRYFGMVGALLKDAYLIEEAKRYFREMLMFSAFPNGAMGEYERNGDYGRPNAGLTYAAVNLQVWVELADAYARLGDFELYTFKTSEGLWGTEGGEKSLKLLIDTYVQTNNGTLERYYDSVSPDNRIDWYAEVPQTYFIHELWFLPTANLYYKDPELKKAYLNPGESLNGYPDGRIGTAGPTGPVWVTSGAASPGVLFTRGQMENLAPY